MQQWDGFRILILGVARQGIALAQYLVRHGAMVVVNDRRSDAELASNLAYFDAMPVDGMYVLGGDQTVAMQVVAGTAVQVGVRYIFK